MDIDFSMFQNYLQKGGTEQGVFARFYDKYIKTGKILENGLPEFEEVVYVEIRVKDSHEIADRRATREDFARFPREYSFYTVKKEKAKEGTPLNMFAFLSLPQIEACASRGIFTVEDLAGLDEDKAHSINLEMEVALAKKFLDVSKNNQVIADYEKEVKKLKARISKLEEENKALKEQK